MSDIASGERLRVARGRPRFADGLRLRAALSVKVLETYDLIFIYIAGNFCCLENDVALTQIQTSASQPALSGYPSHAPFSIGSLRYSV
jgi:hypothetical protein